MGVGEWDLGSSFLALRKLVLKSTLHLCDPCRHGNQSWNLVPRRVLGLIGINGSFKESFAPSAS